MEISKEIMEVFDYIGEKLGIAIDWSSENIMPYIEQLCGKYINYEIATSIFWMAVGIALLFAGILLFRKLELDFYDIEAVVFEVMIVLGIVLILFQIHDIIKCVYLPELKIYEYISMLLKNGN